MGDELFDSLLVRPDLTALDAWLAAADDAHLRRAAAWQRSHKVALSEFRPSEAGEVSRTRTWAATLLIASCASPHEAAKTLPWNDWWFVRDDERELLVRALHRRPRAWAEAFVPAAAEVKLGRRSESATAPFLFLLLDALIRRHELPVPDGDAFLNGWARADPAEDRYLPVLLPALLRRSHLRHRPSLPAALESKIASGEIARTDVAVAVLEALVAPLRPSAQRVLADVLSRLALTSEELAGRLPLLQNALATAHGSVTAVLLPVTVSLAREPTDLDQIVTVIASRAEKRQQATLLGLLEGRDLRERLGVDATLRALAHLDACEDAALRERVARLRRRLGDVPEPEPAKPSPAHGGLWTPLVRQRPPAAEPLHRPARLGHADIRRLLGESWSPEHAAGRGYVNRIGHATLLEYVAGATAADRDSLRAWLPAHDDATWQGLQPVPSAIICWLRGDLDDGPIYDARIPGTFYGSAVPTWQPRQHIINAAAREALWRAGRVPTVLSTPSLSDGTLQLDALLRRIETGRVPSYTPYDLAQALLRLRPISRQDRTRVEHIDDLALPADPACWAERTSDQGRLDAAPQDGVELITRWVHEGGLRPLDARWQLIDGAGQYGGIGWEWVDDPPLPAGVLDSLLVDAAGLADWTSTPAAVTLAPCWTDLAAASLGCERRTDVRADVVIEGTGPMGTPAHAAVLAPLAGPPEDQRRGVLGLLELARRDALSAKHVRYAVETLNLAGVLPLARVAHGFEQAFGAGGLAHLWPVAVGVTADAAQRRPLPSGMPDLLRLLAAYLPAVPDRDLPAELTALAAARGTSKSHAEARALMAVREAS